MIRAISVERRPRILPLASMMNHFGSMSPCLGKYVRMTLPEYTSQLRFDLRRTAAQGNGSAPRVIQRQPHTFPTGKGQNGTPPEQPLSRNSFPICWCRKGLPGARVVRRGQRGEFLSLLAANPDAAT